jgi:hypothetical protein
MNDMARTKSFMLRARPQTLVGDCGSIGLLARQCLKPKAGLTILVLSTLTPGRFAS